MVSTDLKYLLMSIYKCLLIFYFSFNYALTLSLETTQTVTLKKKKNLFQSRKKLMFYVL